MGPQAVSPSSIRTLEVWSRKPRSGAYTCQAALGSSGRLRGRCALPTRAILSVYPIPRCLRALAPSLSGHSALDGSPGALGSGARAKAVRRWLGDVSVTGATQGPAFPLRGAPVPVPSQVWVREQAGHRSCGLVVG